MELNIIVPVYNEKNFAESTLRNLDSLSIDKKIIVVDDCSQDGSYELLEKLQEELNFTLLRHGMNKGKGAAIKTGLKHADAPWTIVFDADSEYNAKDIIKLIGMAERMENAVYGSRFMHRKTTQQPYTRYIANKFLTRLANVLFRPQNRLTDIETCLKLIPTRILKELNLKSDDFSIEIEITSKLIKKNVEIKEISASYNYRTCGEGKKITFFDGVKAITAILRGWLDLY